MLDRFKPVKLWLAGALAVGLLAGCAHTDGTGNRDDRDPLEPFNRSMFAFNERVDKFALKPAAEGYKKVVPAPVRGAVGNFFRNLGEPTTIVNGLLQGKFPQAGKGLARFAVNSTLGLLGLVDVATSMGLERHDEDFGQTMRLWGMDTGPYLVLPLLGPSTVIDSIGMVPATLYTDPRTAGAEGDVTYGLLATDIVDSRARALGASKIVDLQLDPYVFHRETYLQRREELVHDGEPPLEEDWDWD